MGDLSILAERGWLSERSAGFRRTVLNALATRDFSAGEAIYRCGDPADGLYGILSGTVRIATPGDDGQEVIAHHERAGFWIGDLAMLAGQERLVTVEATSPCRTAYLSTVRIHEMVERDSRHYQDFYALSHINMRSLLRIVANLSATGSDRRVALRLLHLDDAPGRSGGWIRIGQEELADLVGLSLPTLQRSLRRFGEAGLVEAGYGRLRVLDRDALLRNAQI